ncbi:GNAT family N-acetyltransferase [Demequina mangrovi]|uniref:Acetyltransferase (GNAT) domain-containing protein n=1 Tax=Demequina mangrovi TaxID=1043493 RepID=A0A1H6U9K9_9MICO|nr:GNAT family N-acetyltransferase [Demequina mangrovi]SEI89058.1 Acetyltransferase (GNAT) domain-containing protein [Demequina mangrovi]
MTELVLRTDAAVTAAQYVEAVRLTAIASRMPLDSPEVIEAALAASDILVTAWDGDRLVGFLRAVTDFQLICYLQELGVVEGYQGAGVGLELQRLMRGMLGPRCKVRVSEAPSAAGYYARVGYRRHDRSWELLPGEPLG